MDYPIHILNTLKYGLIHFVFKGIAGQKLYNDAFMFLKTVFFSILAETDEMPPYAAFHLGLHCLPRYVFTGSQNVKDISTNIFGQRKNYASIDSKSSILNCTNVYA